MRIRKACLAAFLILLTPSVGIPASASTQPAGAGPHAGTPQSPPKATAASSPASADHSDFNGDGYADLAVGLPYEDVGTHTDAGAILVMYGSGTTPHVLSGAGSKVWTQNTAGILGLSEAGDRFGSALASGDFDGDGYADLAIGIPGEDLGTPTLTDAGAVAIIYGSASGLASTGHQLWTQDSSGIADQAESGDQFGYALAAGNLNPPFMCSTSQVDDLAIGVPYEDLNATKVDAGAVNVLFGSPDGLSSCSNEYWTQNSDGVGGTAETGDHFGKSLAMGHFDAFGESLAIGVPDEDLGTATDAGGVNFLEAYFGLMGSDIFWNENYGDVTGVAETGDHFGYALAAADFYSVYGPTGFDDLAVGVYGQDDTYGADVGAVHILPGLETDPGITDYKQEYLTPISEQAGEQFGYALSAGYTLKGNLGYLAIGAPYKDVGAATDAGAVELRYYGGGGSMEWTQDLMGVDPSETSDKFGLSLVASYTSGTYTAMLAIGTPREDVGTISNAGAVCILYGKDPLGFGGTDAQFWNEDSPDVGGTAEAADRLGEAVG
jgi:hypothetical protein